MTEHEILIVDDEESMRELIRLSLGDEEFTFREAESVDGAWRALEERVPDLLLCDFGMPGGDGFELVRRVRAAEHLARLPIVMLTAFDQVERALEGISLGTSDYVVKPFDPDDLRSRVRFQLRERPGDGEGVVFPAEGADPP